MRRNIVNVFVLTLFGAVLAALMLPVIANGNRICFGPGSVRAAVFMQPQTIEVYTINPDDQGELQLSYSQSYLASLPGRPPRNLLLGASDVHIHVEMWRLTNGQYMVLAGPDGENKMHECIFGGSSARVRTYLYTGEALAESGQGADEAVATASPTAGNDDEPTSSAPTDPAPTDPAPTSEPTADPTQPPDPTPISTREVTFGG